MQLVGVWAIVTCSEVAIHMDVAASVDAALEGRPIPVQAG